MSSLPEVVSPRTTAETARSYRPVALAILTLVLIALCGILVLPFLPALAWGVALAVIAWPLQTWMRQRVPRPAVAAALTTIAVVIVIVVPGLFVAYHLTREAGATADRIRQEQGDSTVRDKLAETPATSGAVTWLERTGVNVDREVHRAIEANTRDVSSLVQGSMMGIVQFAVAMFILYHLLLDRAQMLTQLRVFLPMTREEADRVVRSAADSVHANLHATLVTSVIDGISGGVIFWLLGLPSPFTWGVVMFFLSFLPLLGTWLIWLPAVIFLAFNGQWLNAVILLAWGIAETAIVDNVIYVRIAGDRMRLHQVPALLAFLGGLSVFGVSGMILGPGILAVTVAILDVWHHRANGTAPLMAASGEPAPAANVIASPATNGSPRPEVVPVPG